jgi:hypothetical protein
VYFTACSATHSDDRKVVFSTNILGLATHCWLFADKGEDRLESDVARRRIQDVEEFGFTDIPKYAAVYGCKEVLDRLQRVFRDASTVETSLCDAIELVRDLYKGHRMAVSPGLLKDVMAVAWRIVQGKTKSVVYEFPRPGSALLE